MSGSSQQHKGFILVMFLWWPLFCYISPVGSSSRFLIKRLALLFHGMIPPGGVLSSGPELVFLIEAPSSSGKHFLLSFLVFLGWAASHVDSSNMVGFVPVSSLGGQICKIFAFLSCILFHRLISAWRDFQSWAEVVLDVPEVAPAHLGFFPGRDRQRFWLPLWSSSWTGEGLSHSLGP